MVQFDKLKKETDLSAGRITAISGLNSNKVNRI
mgnify:FL=1